MSNIAPSFTESPSFTKSDASKQSLTSIDLAGIPFYKFKSPQIL